jgi:D-alanyl-lipoteichoic acid acyltransferase DltB (MBOAT superfamily)
MLFNSVSFLWFFPLVTALYFVLPHRLRWGMLLAASCIFYCYFIPAYLLILLFTIVVDYVAGLLLASTTGSRKKWILGASICANVGVLVFFKYIMFLNDNLAALAGFLGWRYPLSTLNIILPIGLSFHTFQAMSYTIEVYRGNQQVERHLGIYALYVMFYPQLVAGPIERPQNLLHQFREVHAFDEARVTEGLRMMLWGMFKKVVIADNLALIVNPVYAHPHDYHGIALLIATVFFSFQIYCDVSGYSDIALGAAKVMGFTLMRNFRSPYFSASISEFWRRWHISLSSWFRDYVYIPLGGSRVSRSRTLANLVIVFVMSGLWHGANWTYIVWGALHGFFLAFGLMTDRLRKALISRMGLIRWPRALTALRMLSVYGMVTLGWVFFRAATLPDAFLICRRIASGTVSVLQSVVWPVAAQQGYGSRLYLLGYGQLIWCAVLIGVIVGVEALNGREGNRRPWVRLPLWARWVACEIMVLATLYLGASEAQQFIYFQF